MTRRNLGGAIDALAARLPHGSARRFVESWPRRMTLDEAAARFLALLEVRQAGT